MVPPTPTTTTTTTTTTTRRQHHGRSLTPRELKALREKYSNVTCTTTTIDHDRGCIRKRDGSSSSVLYLPAEDVRLLHVTSILPTAKGGFWMWVSYAPILALEHFNQRWSPFLPDLTERIGEDCNLYLTSQLRTSGWAAGIAGQNLYQSYATAFTHQQITPQNPPPGAVLGSVVSGVSQALAILTGSLNLPQISPASTSPELDNKSMLPTFSRTVPTNTGDAHALVAYMGYLNVYHFNVVYLLDNYGTNFMKEIVTAGTAKGMTIQTVAFRDNYDDEQWEEEFTLALKPMQDSGYRYTFLVACGGPKLLNTLLDLKLIGGHPDQVWIMSEGCASRIEDSFQVRRELGTAMNGWGYLAAHTGTNQGFIDALAGLHTNQETQQHFEDTHFQQDFFFGKNWTAEGPPPPDGFYVKAAYDAMMALGIAACDMKKKKNDDDDDDTTFFSGIDHYNQLLTTTFQGASGHVSFDPTTGTRSYESFPFVVSNLRISPDRSDNTTTRFDIYETHRIEFLSSTRGGGGGGGGGAVITQLNHSFLYNDNTTNIPPPLPPPLEEEDLNLIPDSIRIVGWTLASIAMFLSLVALVATYLKRTDAIIRASQPFFLALVCTGAFLVAFAAIPFGLQEPLSQNVLDIACMVPLWSASTGFTLAFSALFSKTRRVHMILNSAQAIRRIKLEAKDVMLTMTVLAITNFAILITFTIVDPLTWKRIPVEDNLDRYGRTRESHGSCYSYDHFSTAQFVFLSLLGAVNAIPVFAANYMTYQARNIASEVLNESVAIAVSMLGMMEIILIGGPVLLVITKNGEPSATFMVLVVLSTVTSLALFLPVYVSKISLMRDGRTQRELFNPTSLIPLEQEERSVGDSSRGSRCSRGSMNIRRHGGSSSKSSSKSSNLLASLWRPSNAASVGRPSVGGNTQSTVY